MIFEAYDLVQNLIQSHFQNSINPKIRTFIYTQERLTINVRVWKIRCKAYRGIENLAEQKFDGKSS